MNKQLRNGIIKYTVAVVVAGALSYSYATSNELWSLGRMEQYRVLCDAFTIPGVVMLMAGLLVTLAGMGSLDGVGYALSKFFQSFIPGTTHKDERYSDYVERKHGKGPSKGHYFLYVIGLLWFAVGMVFYYLFYTLYG